jgi:prepilin-type N-terminal cleavage/methylation domain-containing protein
MDIGLKELSLRLVRNLSALLKEDSRRGGVAEQTRRAGMTGSDNAVRTEYRFGTGRVSCDAGMVRRYPSSLLTPHSSLSTRLGFTLLELAVVVFIISLMASLVFPAFYSSGNRLRSDARKMASLLRYLNDNAISTKETYPLKFDLEEGELSWKGPDGEKSEKVRSLAGVDLQSKGELKKGEVTVFFSPLGIREYMALHLREDDKEMTVSINPVSGRVKVAVGWQQ